MNTHTHFLLFTTLCFSDHGKSTLADRLLEVGTIIWNFDALCTEFVIQMTGTIKKKDVGANKQVLDKLKVERERGITGRLILVTWLYFYADIVYSQGSDS